MKRFLSRRKLIYIILILMVYMVAQIININSEKIIYKVNEVMHNIKLASVDVSGMEISTVLIDTTDSNKQYNDIFEWNETSESNIKTLIYQIHYKKTDYTKNYNANDLEIVAPDLLYLVEGLYQSHYGSTFVISADDTYTTNKQYTWSYQKSNGSIILTNNYDVEQSVNFEGTIQISFKLYPLMCKNGTNINLKSIINNQVESNTINFIYNSNHKNYTLSNNFYTVSSLDGFPSGDYTWVNGKFSVSRDSGVRILYNKMNSTGSNPYLELSLPEGVVVLDRTLNPIDGSDNKYKIYNNYSSYCGSSTYLPYRNQSENECITFGGVEYYLGIPNDLYYDKTISINPKLYGIYSDYNEGNSLSINNNGYELISETTNNLKVSNYKFTYTGNLYSIYEVTDKYSAYIDAISDNGKDYNRYSIMADTVYVGNKYDLKVGTDLSYYSDNSNTILSDDSYYITNISFPYNRTYDTCNNFQFIDSNCFRNGNDKTIESNKYDVELWVRYSNESEYTLYQSFKNSGRTFSNFDKHVVGYYFVIKDLIESVTMNTSFDMYLTDENIANDSTITNFSFLEVYMDDELVNEPEASSYSTDLSRSYIMPFDTNNYGHYRQRSFANKKVIVGKTSVQANLSSSSLYTNSNGDKRSQLYTDLVIGEPLNTYSVSTNFKGYEIYYILPEGVSFDQDTGISVTYNGYLNLSDAIKVIKKNDGTKFESISKYISYVKEHLRYEYIENFDGASNNLLKLVVDYSDAPLDCSGIKEIFDTSYSYYTGKNKYERFYFNYNIDKDYIIEDTNTFMISAYTTPIDYAYTVSNFSFVKDTIDINNNGDTDELMYESGSSVSIPTISDTNEEILTQASSDISSYKSTNISVQAGDNYKYKLRIRNINSKITNITIYDSIENKIKKNGEFLNVHDDDNYFRGTFESVDTSYLESLEDANGKQIKVKVYYNESYTPGSIESDSTWKEYNNSIDKTKVKSIAYKIVTLDDETKYAVLPANTLAYVELIMKAPTTTDDDKIVSYNGSWVEWNALDSNDQIVPSVVGINSNIVSVGLPATLTVKHLKYGTNEELAPSETKYYSIGNSYTTRESSLISNLYTFKETGGDDPEGIITKLNTEVIYYYDDTVPYAYVRIYKYGPSYINKRTDEVSYDLSLYGNISPYVGTSEVKLVDHLPYKIDISKSNLNGGVYNEEDSTITWIFHETPDDTNYTDYRKYFTINLVYIDIPASAEKITNTVDVTLTYDDKTLVDSNYKDVYIAEQYDLIVKHLEYGTDKVLAPEVHEKYYGGAGYTTSEENIDGYRLKIRPDNYKGLIEKEVTEVVYYYEDTDPKLDNRIDKLGEDYKTSDYEVYDYTIKYNSSIRDYIGNVSTKTIDYLPYEIDVEKSELDGGVYDSQNKTITWIDDYTTDSIDEVNKEYIYNIKLVYIDRDSNIVTNRVKGTTIIDGVERTVESSIATRNNGIITVKYIDIDTGEELIENVESSGLINDEFIPVPQEIEGYTLVEIPDKHLYIYETDPQVVYYKYKKQAVKGEEEITNPKTGHTNIVFIIIGLLFISIVCYMYVSRIHIFKKY